VTVSRPVRIDLEQVSRTFGRHHALREMSLTVESGRLVGIVGESGSGKSTLARLVAGLDRPTSGRVAFDGENLSRTLQSATGRRLFRSAVQLIGQDTTSSFDPRRTLRDALRQPAQRLLGLTRDEADARIDDLTASLGLRPGSVDRKPTELSGGQRQRVSIARALIVAPRLLLCDEVVSALDVSVQGSILNTLKRYCRETGAGLVFVSHGLAATAFLSSEIVVMRSGAVVEHGPVEQVMRRPEHPYTRALLDAHLLEDAA
jgi:peptide/nickel transport system ATP-binding protein